jgi:cell division protein FtsZ
MSKAITVLAAGGAGCRIIQKFTALDAAQKFRLLALDSDASALQNSGVSEENWIQAGRLLRSGRGCGGDIIAGQQALANERKLLNSVLASTDVLIIVAGLGGGLATGGLPVILGVAAKLHITTAVLVTLPFAMEGFQRRHIAEEKIKNDLLPIADAVIALPNDLLFSTMEAETPVSEAFRKSDEEISRTLFAVASVLGGANLFNADFAAFTGVLKRRHTLCALGTAMVDNDENAASLAMDELLASPLLGGPETLDNADAVVFSLIGGPELSMGSARAVLDLCARQVNPDFEKKLLLGAATDADFAGKVQLTALTVRYLDNREPSSENAPAKHSFRRNAPAASGDDGEQLALPNLDIVEKGIMENTTPVMLDGEDLDVPTFIRRGLVIECGK